jgi:hypothetical protein
MNSSDSPELLTVEDTPSVGKKRKPPALSETEDVGPQSLSLQDGAAPALSETELITLAKTFMSASQLVSYARNEYIYANTDDKQKRSDAKCNNKRYVITATRRGTTQVDKIDPVRLAAIANLTESDRIEFDVLQIVGDDPSTSYADSVAAKDKADSILHASSKETELIARAKTFMSASQLVSYARNEYIHANTDGCSKRRQAKGDNKRSVIRANRRATTLVDKIDPVRILAVASLNEIDRIEFDSLQLVRDAPTTSNSDARDADAKADSLLHGAFYEEREQQARGLFSSIQLITYNRNAHIFKSTTDAVERVHAKQINKRTVETAMARETKHKEPYAADRTIALKALSSSDKTSYDEHMRCWTDFTLSHVEAKEAKWAADRVLAASVLTDKTLRLYDANMAVAINSEVTPAQRSGGGSSAYMKLENALDVTNRVGDVVGQVDSLHPGQTVERPLGAHVKPDGLLPKWEDIKHTTRSDSGRSVQKNRSDYTDEETWVFNDHIRMKRTAAADAVRARLEAEGLYAIDGTKQEIRQLARGVIQNAITGLCKTRWSLKFGDASVIDVLRSGRHMFYLGIHSNGDVTHGSTCNYETSCPFIREGRKCVTTNENGTLLTQTELRDAGFKAFTVMQFNVYETAQWAEEAMQEVCDEYGIQRGFRQWLKTGSGKRGVGWRSEKEIEHAAGGKDSYAQVFLSLVDGGDPSFNIAGEITGMRLGLADSPDSKRVCCRPVSDEYIPTSQRIAAYEEQKQLKSAGV